jgi:hypothetical protein
MYPSADSQRRLHDFKLEGDLRDAYVELLSAQRAVDRVRTRYSPDEVAHCSSKFIVARSISAAFAIHEFFNAVHRSMMRDNESPAPSSESQSNEKPI